MAIPSVRSVGAVSSGTTITALGLPSGYQENDILVIVASTANQDPSTNPPDGWTAAPNLPTGTGTAAAIGAVKLFVWWKRASASESTVNFGTTFNYCVARMMAISGCVTTGDPWDASASTQQTSASTSLSFPSITTTVADTLVVLAASFDRDASSTANLPALTNANLSSITERMDNLVTTGRGGGIGCATGGKASTGSTGTTTGTITSSIYHTWTGNLKPAPVVETINVDTKVHTITELDPNINARETISVDTKTHTLTTLAATIANNATIVVDLLSINQTELDVTINARTSIAVDTKAHTIVERDVTINARETVSVDTKVHTITPLALTIEQPIVIHVDTLAINQTELDVNVNARANVSVDTRAHTITELDASINARTKIDVDARAHTITTNDISLLESSAINVDTLAIVVTPLSATLLEAEVITVDLLTHAVTTAEVNINAEEIIFVANGAAPAEPWMDDFNRANGELSSPWQAFGSDPLLEIVSNQVVVSSGAPKAQIYLPDIGIASTVEEIAVEFDLVTAGTSDVTETFIAIFADGSDNTSGIKLDLYVDGDGNVWTYILGNGSEAEGWQSYTLPSLPQQFRFEYIDGNITVKMGATTLTSFAFTPAAFGDYVYLNPQGTATNPVTIDNFEIIDPNAVGGAGGALAIVQTLQDATVIEDTLIAVDTFTQTIAPQTVTLNAREIVSVDARSHSIVPHDVTISADAIIPVVTRTFEITTQDVGVNARTIVSVDALNIVQAFHAVEVSAGDAISVETLAMIVSTLPVTILSDEAISVDTRQLNVTLLPCDVYETSAIVVQTLSTNVTTHEVAVLEETIVTIEKLDTTITTHPVSFIENETIYVDTYSVTITPMTVSFGVIQPPLYLTVRVTRFDLDGNTAVITVSEQSFTHEMPVSDWIPEQVIGSWTKGAVPSGVWIAP